MSAQPKQLKLNIPQDVKRWLAEEANRNMRSQSSEAVFALKEKMERQRRNVTPEDGRSSTEQAGSL